jgi:hypothetical protein
VVIWYIFPRFGILHQEKSGNPNGELSVQKCTYSIKRRFGEYRRDKKVKTLTKFSPQFLNKPFQAEFCNSLHTFCKVSFRFYSQF